MSATYVCPSPYVNMTLTICSPRRVQSLFPHGKFPYMCVCCVPLTIMQHCIFSWLKQESSQEKCPMCRQRTCRFKLSKLVLTLWCSLQVKESRCAGAYRTRRRSARSWHQPDLRSRNRFRSVIQTPLYYSRRTKGGNKALGFFGHVQSKDLTCRQECQEQRERYHYCNDEQNLVRP